VFSNIFAWVGFAAVPVSILGFMVSRAVLGFGEAGNFPAAIKATAEYFPKKSVRLLLGYLTAGQMLVLFLLPLPYRGLPIIGAGSQLSSS
jgi:ACS family hexuronate transporter-like MFS transporter